jgi:tripartite-type tricarboxylate transporter receptor subunit TctC
MITLKPWLRKLALSAGIAAAAVAGSGAAHAQQGPYPNHPVRIVIGFVAGGVSDAMMRMLAPELSAELGQPVIVENRPGAAGIPAAEYVAKSAPDGYTLYMAPNTHLVNQAIHAKLPFDVIKDFKPITLLTSTVNLLMVNVQSPITDLNAYIKAAREKPGEMSYATSGVGTTTHLAGEMLASQAGVKLNHIPYKGANQSVEAVLAGHVASSVSAIASSRAFIDAGKVRVLGVMGEKRSAFLPNVPTFAEQGYPKMVSDTWLGIIGPANMPPQIAARLDTAFKKLLARPEIREKIARLGSEVVGIGLEEFGAREAAELATILQVARAANIKAE